MPSLEPQILRAYGHDASIIVSDPPDHDRARRQLMRHFGPPHAPDVIPKMEPDIQRLCKELLDNVKAKGENRFDVVDDYAYPVPVAVICKILGVPPRTNPPSMPGSTISWLARTWARTRQPRKVRLVPVSASTARRHSRSTCPT